ncbi:MAG: BlaI/MecI/CopY family transcriptional regulator [Anaerolineae bacterium]
MPEEKLITTFRPSGQGLDKLFGKLEAKIMDILWNESEATARVVFEALRDQGQRLSYSTVKTVLERLVDKGVLEKERHTKAYVYRSRLNREDFTRSAVGQIIDSLLASFTEPVMSCFVDRLSKANPDRVARLLEMIEQENHTASKLRPPGEGG